MISIKTNGFYRKEQLPLKGCLLLKRVASNKRNYIHLNERLQLKETASTKKKWLPPKQQPLLREA